MSKTVIGIITATVVNNIIGFVWYSPLAFGPLWAQFVNIDFNADMGTAPIIYGLLLTACVAVLLAFIIKKMNLNIQDSIKMAVVGWLTFSVPYGLQGCIYAGLAPTFFAINAGYNLCAYVAMAAIIGFFNQR